MCYVCERERERETTTHTHKHTLTVLARVREKDTAHTASTEPPVPLLPTLHTAPVSISLSRTYTLVYSDRCCCCCLPACLGVCRFFTSVRSFVRRHCRRRRRRLSHPFLPGALTLSDWLPAVRNGRPDLYQPSPPPPHSLVHAPPFFMDIFFFIVLISFFTFARDFFLSRPGRGGVPDSFFFFVVGSFFFQSFGSSGRRRTRDVSDLLLSTCLYKRIYTNCNCK